MPDAIDPYKILQVDPEAEDEVITAAYRRLARKYHPDLAQTPDAASRMAAINAAWELIGEPAKRAMYDRLRRASQARTIEPAGDRAGSGSRGTTGATGGSHMSGSNAAHGGGRGSPHGTGPAAGGAPTRPTSGGIGGDPGATTRPAQPRPPDVVSRDWTSGRSSQGGGFDESMRAADGLGAAGPPPGRPSGSVLNFGRYAGWSLGEISRQDLEYIEWLDRTPIGRSYRDEIDGILRSAGRRRSAAKDDDRRGLYRRR
jgi:curved DNA-binding protein CbpA